MELEVLDTTRERQLLKQSLYGSAPRTADYPHVTEIIQRVGVMVGKIKEGDGDIEDGPWEMAADIGFLWERIIEGVLLDPALNVVRLGELVEDRIALNIDGIAVGQGVDGLELYEYKVIWASSNKDLREDWKRMAQVKAYLYALSRKFGVRILSAVMIVLYPCGNYRPPAPQLVKVRVRFGWEEIVENWLMLKGNRPPGYEESMRDLYGS